MSKSVTTLFGNPIPAGDIAVFADGKLVAPVHNPIVPYVPGDGIGPEIWPVAISLVNEAMFKCYRGSKRIVWLPVYAGDYAVAKFGTNLPEDTITAFDMFHIGAKGPLGTPPSGQRSLNVKLRVMFDLDQCIRPIHYIKGVPSPVVRPGDLDIVIFRQNTEGCYTGIEFAPGSEKAEAFIKMCKEFGHSIPAGSGITLSFASEAASKNLVRKAIQYAIDNGRQYVTIVAKSNNLKYTDGAFLAWGFEVAKDEFGDVIVTEEELKAQYNGKLPEGKILLNSKITDDMFAQLLRNPTKYHVVATTNLNGDYLSDAAAEIHGGLGQAAGVNKGPRHVIYEPTHGTAPDIAGQNKANPLSLILSLTMMLDDLGFEDAAELVRQAIVVTVANKTVTGDFAWKMRNATALSTTEFGAALIANLGKPLPERNTLAEAVAEQLRASADKISG